MIPPKTFISYCWTSEDHKYWVLNLAKRLKSDGIDVSIDIWHLKPGQDIYHFMEKNAMSSDIDRIIVICDRGYYLKAEKRIGGVGTETQIISPDVYNNVNQEKVIPVVVEKNEQGIPYIPSYMKSRLYIDLSTRDKYESGYRNLVRHILGVPEEPEPELGNFPSWLQENIKEDGQNVNDKKRQEIEIEIIDSNKNIKLLPETESMLDRFLLVFNAHGININEIPFLLPKEFGITLQNFITKNSIISILTNDLIEWTAKTFNVKKSWILGTTDILSSYPYELFGYYKRINRFIARLIDLRNSSVKDLEVNFIKVGSDELIANEDRKGEVLLTLSYNRTIGTNKIADIFEPTHDIWYWGYWRSRFQIKSIIYICEKCSVITNGYEISKSEVENYRKGFPSDFHTKFNSIKWYPEDYVTNPKNQISKDSEEYPLVINYINEQGYMDCLNEILNQHKSN
ncbi:toll/interleukin-1 receptor domain-containing protein [Brevibacillus choshinensis]|uniref:toll/interleukin-1 receptor domain-containing protein n=1 Tax=Brevibacillus choshinensis TaxID=54911 RepID=UPI0006EC2AEE|nr:toll/interleukin-1 receptor domain-containing protein [Brevibacillus choshinensis]